MVGEGPGVRKTRVWGSYNPAGMKGSQDREDRGYKGPAHKKASVGREERDPGVPGQEGSPGREPRASAVGLVASHLETGLGSQGRWEPLLGSGQI